ncbi:MAG TPA: glycosyltransferase [Verrucomicrobiae bacterium]|nr:glycosyltransferase [Verrucomicrobiae bacterium]
MNAPMLSTPAVSVVMSVLDGERFLHTAVESILGQSFGDIEFIIVDDGSGDRTASMLDSYERLDSRVRVCHQENRGLVESLNRACALARGKYIARMDADDIAVRDRLGWQVDFMEKHPEVAALGGSVELIDATGRTIRIAKFPLKNWEIQRALLETCALCHPTVIMRRDVLLSVNGYRRVVVDAEDYDLWLRIAERHQLANLKQVVLKYRVHSSQISVRRCRQEGLSGLAARTAASSRRTGRPDPLTSVESITPASLSALGVSEAVQQAALSREYLRCIRNMYRAREYSVALAALDMLRGFDLKKIDNWVVADFHLWAARLHWRQRRFIKSVLSGGRALIKRPIILGRPIKLVVTKLNQGRG